MNTKDLLIIEKSSSELKFSSEGGKYVLEGVFGELDKKNRNNRIYTAEEYLPQIEALQAKIKASKLLGELDHPQNFDISLKNVSHIIEEITYDESAKQIRGRIRLLDTDAGRQAKALVDAGVPLQISSRAAGAVESNGKVKIKQLFTYDLVADPGFENAELVRVNESYGFSVDDNIQIFEINKKEQTQIITENKPEEKMAESKFITVEDFNKYSKYLAEEIKSIKEGLNEANTTKDESTTTKLENYVNYLSEKLDQAIQYSEHVAEKTDQSIQYSESLAEKLDQSIQYSEHLAEGMEKIKGYTNYLAESYNEGATTHENLLEYIDYLKSNLEKVTEYAEYVAETVNSNLIVESDDEGAGKEVEEIEDEQDNKDVTEPTVDAEGKEYKHGEEKSDDSKELEDDLEGEGDAEGEEISEADEVEEEAEEEVEEGNAFGDAVTKAKEAGESKFEFEGKTYKVEEDENLAAEEEVEEEVEESNDTLDAYKNSITEKLQALINKAEEKKTTDPHFFRFVSESTRNSFNELETAYKSKVLNAIEGRGFLTEGQILGLWNTALITDAPNASEPNVIKMMPNEYKETFSKLSESKKNQIIAQSKYHKLETQYQVTNFWQTRDLRETAQVMEKVELVNESKGETKSLPYDLTGVQESLAKRFKK
jgi:hypothetical protein